MMLNLTDRRYTALVRYAREANLNMLRSEGFSIRETENFYNRCDELGVMVTQQIFGRNIPDEALAISCIEDMMLRIRNHPSLAHFLGHDETFPTPSLSKAYLEMIERLRVHRTYQPHSGAFSVSERKQTGGTRTGTLELWTYAVPSHYYLRKNDGAWGFAQSGGIGGITVVRDSLRQMMPEDELWPPLQSEDWSFHTVTQGAQYFTEVKRAMARGYGAPKDIDDFCNKAYAMNYNSARGMYEAYGRNKYSATGITTWKYDAAWPAATTWAYVDWYLRPTGAYFGAKKACEPLHVQYAYDDDGIYVINSLYEPFSSLEVSATLYNFDLTPKLTKKATVRCGPRRQDPGLQACLAGRAHQDLLRQTRTARPGRRLALAESLLALHHARHPRPLRTRVWRLYRQAQVIRRFHPPEYPAAGDARNQVHPRNPG